MYKPAQGAIKILESFDPTQFTRASVGCLVLSQDGKIVLQLRDENSPTFPGRLATFGGGIEANETPMQALIRELQEELGAAVKARDVVSLGVISEQETNYKELIYVYFWHDKHGSITGCYEGRAKYFDDAQQAAQDHKIMHDVCWLLSECIRRKLFTA